MTEDQILAEFTDILRDLLDQSHLTLTRDTVASDVEGWDSVNHINIVVAAEMRFGIKFRTVELDEIHNVGEFVDLIAQKLRR
jgi:acyl carrier protein